MFHQQFYDPQSLIDIQHQNKYKIRPELYLKRELIVDERELVKQLLYMISGIETELFVKRFDQIQINNTSGSSDRIFHFQLREDCRTIFTHLTHDAILSCTDNLVKVANMIMYLNLKSKYMYENTTNTILKCFAQGVIAFINRFTAEITHMLTHLQKQSAKITVQNIKPNHRQQQYCELTLLKINIIFQQKQKFISQIVCILGKIIPYIGSMFDQDLQTDKYRAVKILFDQFWRTMSSSELNDKEQTQVLLIYESSLLFYLSMIQNWIQMNPYLLQTKANIPFFVKLSSISFSLSKGTFQYRKKQLNGKKVQSSLLSKQQSCEIQKFIQLFYKLDNLLVQEYLPQMFKKHANTILQLGKIIQFIYLYFSVQQRNLVQQYFSVAKTFSKLRDFIQFKKIGESLNTKNSLFSDGGLNKNIRKKKGISQRLKNNRQQKRITLITVQGDNPYQMFSTIRGVFNDNQEIIGQAKEIRHKNTNAKQKVDTDKPSSNHNTQKSKVSQNLILKFQRILADTINKIYQKTLFFFQQQSSKQYFKIITHHKDSLSRSSFNQSIFSSFSINRNSFISFDFAHLENLQNTERIIESISLTLIGIKKFMLFQQGDFFIELINSGSELFQLPITKIKSIRNSSANNLPDEIKDKVSFSYIKITKNSQIKHLEVWRVFTMLFKPQFPVNCIFNQQIMQGFGEVFNFIFGIKKYQFFLKNVWADFKQNAKIQTQCSLFQTNKHPFESKILAIRNNLHHFINTIYGFIMIVIETHWNKYIQQINVSFSSKKSQSMKQQMQNEQNKKQKIIHNPITLIKLTSQLLNSFRSQITQNVDLSNSMILVSQLLDKFKKLIKNQPDSKDWDQQHFRKQIQYISRQFGGILDIVKQVEGIGETIFYNNQFM